MEERCLFFLFQWRESVRRGARRGALGVPPAACGTNVGCVFWVAESGGACAGGGTRRGESGRSNQHKEERVRVEERENTHDCVRCCDCELCEGGVHLLSPVCVACPVCVSMVPLLSKAWKVLETALRKLANFATTHVCVARLNHRARGRLLT